MMQRYQIALLPSAKLLHGHGARRNPSLLLPLFYNGTVLLHRVEQHSAVSTEAHELHSAHCVATLCGGW
jgi:hypothetical protein